MTMKLAILFALALATGCASRGRQVAHSTSSAGAAGHLKWDITDASGNAIGHGEGDFKASDVTVDTISSEMGELRKVTIPLSDGFSMAVATSENDRDGLGLTADRKGEPLFCWDWFNVQGSRAKKIQESGDLDLEFNGDRVKTILFASDVSLRLYETSAGADLDLAKPQVRIRISQGSHISMPQ